MWSDPLSSYLINTKAKEIGSRYKDLDEDEKAKWTGKADELKEEYKKELAKYEKSKPAAESEKKKKSSSEKKPSSKKKKPEPEPASSDSEDSGSYASESSDLDSDSD